MFDIPGAIKSVTGFAGKFFTDKTEKMKMDSSHAELMIKTNAKMAELALERAKDGDMAVYKDLASSRALYAKEMERAPYLIRLLNGLVRPLGGLGALATVFWMVWAQYFGYPKLDMPDIDTGHPIMLLLGSIIGFFFVLRHRAQVKGVKDK